MASAMARNAMSRARDNAARALQGRGPRGSKNSGGSPDAGIGVSTRTGAVSARANGTGGRVRIG